MYPIECHPLPLPELISTGTASFVPSPASSGYTAAFASTDTVAAHVRLSRGQELKVSIHSQTTWLLHSVFTSNYCLFII